MRLAVTSDLHLGLTPPERIRSLAASLAALEPDVLAVAGDVGEGPSRYLEALRILTEALPDAERLAVPGNHDLWAREGATSRELFATLLPTLTRDGGFRWLEGRPFVRGSVAVAGTAAWYDFSAAEPGLEYGPAWYAGHRRDLYRDAAEMDADFDDRAFAAARADALRADLASLRGTAGVERVLVVTHVPVLEEQLVRRPSDRDWALRTPFFANLTLGADVLADSRVTHVVSGHTHLGRRARVYRKGAPPLNALVVGSEVGRPDFVTVEVDTDPAPGGEAA